MGRREELERELTLAQERIDYARADTQQEVMDNFLKERDSIFIELNNLYDDPETESE